MEKNTQKQVSQLVSIIDNMSEKKIKELAHKYNLFCRRPVIIATISKNNMYATVIFPEDISRETIVEYPNRTGTKLTRGQKAYLMHSFNEVDQGWIEHNSPLIVSSDVVSLDDIISGTVAVGDSHKLNGEVASYYLNYNNLTNTPNIPTKLSELQNDSGFVKDAYYVHTDNNYTNADKNKLSSIEQNAQVNLIEKITRNGVSLTIANKTVDITVPTTTSDLTNNSGYITNAVNNLVNYYNKNNVYTKTEVNSLIDAIDTIKFEIVATLPTSDISTTTIYLLSNLTGEQDYYDEYIYISNQWELIGTTKIDLTNYYTKNEINNILSTVVNDVVDNKYYLRTLGSWQESMLVPTNGSVDNFLAYNSQGKLEYRSQMTSSMANSGTDNLPRTVSAKVIKDAIKNHAPVKTVNNIQPDTNGNIDISSINKIVSPTNFEDIIVSGTMPSNVNYGDIYSCREGFFVNIYTCSGFGVQINQHYGWQVAVGLDNTKMFMRKVNNAVLSEWIEIGSSGDSGANKITITNGVLNLQKDNVVLSSVSLVVNSNDVSMQGTSMNLTYAINNIENSIIYLNNTLTNTINSLSKKADNLSYTNNKLQLMSNGSLIGNSIDITGGGTVSTLPASNITTLNNSNVETELWGNKIRLGLSSVAGAINSVAIGVSTNSVNNAIAIGGSASAISSNSIAIGMRASTNALAGIAIGMDANATNSAIAIGNGASSIGGYSVSLGRGAMSNGSYTIAIGNSTTAIGTYSIAIGTLSVAGVGNTISIGRLSNASAIASISIGLNSISLGINSIAIGTNSSANQPNAIALGNTSNANGISAMSLGYSTIAGNYSLAIGFNAEAIPNYSTAISYNSNAMGNHSIALGFYSRTVEQNSIAIGSCSSTNGNFAIALGYQATASAVNSTAIGVSAICGTTNGMQLGNATTLSSLSCRVALSVTSDERDKIDIRPIHKSLEFINKIEPIQYVTNEREKYHINEDRLSKKELEKRKKYGLYKYNKKEYKKGTKKGTRKRVGVKAQQVIEVMEEVFGTSDYANIINDNCYDENNVPSDIENKYTVTYESFIPFLIQAVQDLSKEIEELKENKS